MHLNLQGFYSYFSNGMESGFKTAQGSRIEFAVTFTFSEDIGARDF